jgi:histidine triad (HIT) family protein
MPKDGCIFCRIAEKEIPAKIVFEDGALIAFEDINAQAPVHIVVAPKRHIRTVSDLGEDDASLAGEMILLAKRLAKERRIDESGYRIVINCNKDGGQAVFHIHLHLLGGRQLKWPPG